MGQFNLPSTAGSEQHDQPYGIGLGSADAIAASAGTAQPESEKLFSSTQPDETEQLFGMRTLSLMPQMTVAPSVHVCVLAREVVCL